jgi:hypothetical protein
MTTLWVIPPKAVTPSGFPLTLTNVKEDNRAMIEALLAANETHTLIQPSTTQFEIIGYLYPLLDLEVRVVRGLDEEEVSGSWAIIAQRFNTVSVDAIMASRSINGEREDSTRTLGHDEQTADERMSMFDKSIARALDDSAVESDDLADDVPPVEE